MTNSILFMASIIAIKYRPIAFRVHKICNFARNNLHAQCFDKNLTNKTQRNFCFTFPFQSDKMNNKLATTDVRNYQFDS